MWPSLDNLDIYRCSSNRELALVHVLDKSKKKKRHLFISGRLIRCGQVILRKSSRALAS